MGNKDGTELLDKTESEYISSCTVYIQYENDNANYRNALLTMIVQLTKMCC